MWDKLVQRITRREFVATGLGYAAAVSPITAWAITTPETDLVAGDVSVPTSADGKESMPAYRAMPKKGHSFPCVIVVQEIFGIHEYIKDVCRRLAKAGYLAIAPSLYFRQGDATKVPDIKKLIADIVSKVPQAQVMTDLDSTVAWLKKQKSADIKRLGITGFCWGGGVTWMYAAHNPEVKAGVAWYGKLKGEATPNQPRFPQDIAEELKVPVLGLYGEKDAGIPLDTVEKMRSLLAKGKSHSELVVFTGADHGFHADYRPSYHEKSAVDGWNRLLEWFKRHGIK